MRVLSPDACGATRRHQRIHACAECHGARVLKRPQGTRALQYCDEHPLALRTECSTTPKWRSVIYICIYVYIQSVQKRLTFVVMYLCISNIKRAKNLGGNFHVNELHKLISLLVLTQDVIFRLRKMLSSVDLYYMGSALQQNKFIQLIYTMFKMHKYITTKVNLF